MQMTTRAFILITVALCLNLQTVGAQTAHSDDDQKQSKAFYDQALTKSQSYIWLEDLCKIGPRLSGSQTSLDAIHWVKGIMDTCGLDTVYLQPVMVPHWERGKAEEAVLIDGSGQSLPLSVLAIGGSIATAPGGITAEVLEVSSLQDMRDIDAERVKGKIVFYNPEWDQRNIGPGASYGANVGTRSQGAILAARKGAVASVIRSVGSAYDDVPHTGTGSYEKGVDSIPAAALGVISADKLSQALKLDPKIKLRLTINSRWYPDAQSYNVIGEVRGSENPEEIIAMGGHLDSWDVGHGAHDDGAGCMHALGALKLILDEGIRPKRTIRAVMWINEENGTRGGHAYADEAVRKNERHLIAIESDAGGFSPRGFGLTGSEDQRMRVETWLPIFPRNTISYIAKGGGGVDIGPLHRATGVPMMSLSVDGQRMFDLHHSANDVFASVHRREMVLGTASLATMVYLLDQYGL